VVPAAFQQAIFDVGQHSVHVRRLQLLNLHYVKALSRLTNHTARDKNYTSWLKQFSDGRIERGSIWRMSLNMRVYIWYNGRHLPLPHR